MGSVGEGTAGTDTGGEGVMKAFGQVLMGMGLGVVAGVMVMAAVPIWIHWIQIVVEFWQ